MVAGRVCVSVCLGRLHARFLQAVVTRCLEWYESFLLLEGGKRFFLLPVGLDAFLVMLIDDAVEHEEDEEAKDAVEEPQLDGLGLCGLWQGAAHLWEEWLTQGQFHSTFLSFDCSTTLLQPQSDSTVTYGHFFFVWERTNICYFGEEFLGKGEGKVQAWLWWP